MILGFSAVIIFAPLPFCGYKLQEGNQQDELLTQGSRTDRRQSLVAGASCAVDFVVIVLYVVQPFLNY